MTLPVSDSLSNRNDQIENVVRVLGRSKRRINVFKAIYNKKNKIKTTEEIHKITGISLIAILDEGRKLSHEGIVKQIKVGGKIAFTKVNFIKSNRDQILSYVKNPKKLNKLATKTNPILRGGNKVEYVTIQLPQKLINTELITIDSIDDFKLVRNVDPENKFVPVSERKFKDLIIKIIKESGNFTDWGGEKSDLYSTKVKLNNKRIATAFAFKGKGTKGVLTPKKMGANGDQIQRLFGNEAELFIVQYWEKIDQSIYEQMSMFATAKSAITGKKIFFCIIDGGDTSRIIKAYSNYNEVT